MRSESDPRRRIAWQPEAPMSKALWENGSPHEAIVSTTGPRSIEGGPSGIRARAGIVSILGMLLEPGEPAQARFGGHRRGRTSPRSSGDRSVRSVMPRAPRTVRGFGLIDPTDALGGPADPPTGRASRMRRTTLVRSSRSSESLREETSPTQELNRNSPLGSVNRSQGATN